MARYRKRSDGDPSLYITIVFLWIIAGGELLSLLGWSFGWMPDVVKFYAWLATPALIWCIIMGLYNYVCRVVTRFNALS